MVDRTPVEASLFLPLGQHLLVWCGYLAGTEVVVMGWLGGRSTESSAYFHRK